MVELVSLQVGDDPQVWSDLGFTVEGGTCVVGGVRFDLDPERGKGIRAWALAGAKVPDDGLVDRIPTTSTDAVAASRPDAGRVHPNGSVALDHPVLSTPDLDRTIDALTDLGLDLRRTRDIGPADRRMRQAFFLLGAPSGKVVLEVVGPVEPASDDPPRFFGLAFTVADLDATATMLGDRLHPAKDAVQPGRRIATLDRGAGSKVAIAFMSPGVLEYG